MEHVAAAAAAACRAHGEGQLAGDGLGESEEERLDREEREALARCVGRGPPALHATWAVASRVQGTHRAMMEDRACMHALEIGSKFPHPARAELRMTLCTL